MCRGMTPFQNNNAAVMPSEAPIASDQTSTIISNHRRQKIIRKSRKTGLERQRTFPETKFLPHSDLVLLGNWSTDSSTRAGPKSHSAGCVVFRKKSCTELSIFAWAIVATILLLIVSSWLIFGLTTVSSSVCPAAGSARDENVTQARRTTSSDGDASVYSSSTTPGSASPSTRSVIDCPVENTGCSFQRKKKSELVCGPTNITDCYRVWGSECKGIIYMNSTYLGLATSLVQADGAMLYVTYMSAIAILGPVVQRTNATISCTSYNAFRIGISPLASLVQEENSKIRAGKFNLISLEGPVTMMPHSFINAEIFCKIVVQCPTSLGIHSLVRLLHHSRIDIPNTSTNRGVNCTNTVAIGDNSTLELQYYAQLLVKGSFFLGNSVEVTLQTRAKLETLIDTSLRINGMAGLLLRQGATMILEQKNVTLGDEASLVLTHCAQLHIKGLVFLGNSATVELQDRTKLETMLDTTLWIKDMSRIILRECATLILEQNSSLTISKKLDGSSSTLPGLDLEILERGTLIISSGLHCKILTVVQIKAYTNNLVKNSDDANHLGILC